MGGGGGHRGPGAGAGTGAGTDLGVRAQRRVVVAEVAPVLPVQPHGVEEGARRGVPAALQD